MICGSNLVWRGKFSGIHQKWIPENNPAAFFASQLKFASSEAKNTAGWSSPVARQAQFMGVLVRNSQEDNPSNSGKPLANGHGNPEPSLAEMLRRCRD